MANVLLISHYFGCTGAPASLLRHAVYLKNAGHNVDVWSLGGGVLLEQYQKAGFSPIIIKKDYYHIEKAWHNSKTKYDLIVCNTTDTYQCVEVLSKKNVPLVWFIRETALVDEYMQTNKAFAKCFSTYYNLYTISNYALKTICKYNKNVRVINNSVADTFKGFTVFKENLRFGYIGSIIPIKGVDVLLKAFSKVLDEGFDVSLALAGGIEDYAGNLQKIYQKYPQMKWLGEVRGRDKENFFDAIDVLVVPSIDEPGALTLLEGAMKGKILITTENVGSNYVVADQQSGFIVQTNKENAIFQAIKALMAKNKDELRAMQELSRERYLQYGQPQREREGVLKMLAGNIANPPKARCVMPYFLLQTKNIAQKLFYERTENKRKYCFFGIPLLSFKKEYIRICGVKIHLKGKD
ncbi:MAG: glycosyltransferase family 4 protein [Alphaproteobacteria bacterium]|nr:glycosyltransferase family 4 protein [Alphaproteobacteria bacterium]